jgi:methylated-DNA-protein-cysteine methyltransferase related protein
MNTFDKVYKIVAQIPKGKVTTYGAIANTIGTDPRVIGYALHANKNPNTIPCHRVINSKGAISSGYAFGGPDEQIKMLIKEGVNFNKNKTVDLNKFGYFLF